MKRIVEDEVIDFISKTICLLKKMMGYAKISMK